ncbi:hypothetical protein SNOG_01318 [Parastagonospora nodorum SN15]|uniref:Uncharacterized protein n=1 Tax=Phaeosphaeria nodorum (strain SN15 / ATCC MYA-4574 / FGSC 10173) TaxID=321614 RepID=Q0V3U6_PHANO|nr:hypothetical protein SNOG_01318 [Parastagonospora nodorum SN15]EAT90967.1 hypothetical protein SNOG_01318 [Parastagonospora nodorum SN15]
MEYERSFEAVRRNSRPPAPGQQPCDQDGPTPDMEADEFLRRASDAKTSQCALSVPTPSRRRDFGRGSEETMVDVQTNAAHVEDQRDQVQASQLDAEAAHIDAEAAAMLARAAKLRRPLYVPE